jgi:TolA-binding protein
MCRWLALSLRWRTPRGLAERMRRITVLALLILRPLCGVADAADKAIDQEFEFAAGLMRLGLPDYAVIVAERIVADHPEQKERADVVRAEALIGARRMAEAEVLLRSMPKGSPKTYAVQLALADGYYQLGKADLCTELYRDFFKRHEGKVPEDPDLMRFYREAAHKFAQILEEEDDLRGSAGIYTVLIDSLDDAEMKRQIRLEQSEILLRAARRAPGAKDVPELLGRAETNCSEVIWGGMDLWFGRAVTCLAELQVQRGRRDEAMRTLSGNLKMLKKLDEALEKADIPLSESPFAGARSLLGQLHKDEADLLLGDIAKREAAALESYAAALTEAEQVWALLMKVHNRDEVLAEREKVATHLVYGTPDERQQPLRDMGALLDRMDGLLAGNPWAASSASALEALRERLAKLRAALQAFPIADGVTPSPEIALGETFEGLPHLTRGRAYLETEDQRREAAVQENTIALRQFYNVFAGYPGSHWRDEAGEQVTLLKDRLKALTGKDVTIKSRSGGQKRIGLVHMSEGHELLGRKDYAKAAEAYLLGLNAYPDGDESVVALAGLMEARAGLEDSLWVEMVARYVAERFADRPQAAQSLLRMGRRYFEQGNTGMYELLYGLYLDHFPADSAASTILYMLGEQRWNAKDYTGARAYYQRLVDNYPTRAHYLKALNRMAWSYYLAGDYVSAAERFEDVVEKAQPGKQKAEAQLCLADCRRQQERFADGVREYRKLAMWLAEPDTIYTSKAQQDAFKTIHEQAVFFQAYCLGRLEKPPDRVPAYRAAAIKLYDGFVKQFPGSALAPTALSSMGAMHLADGDASKASAAYTRLSAEYPDSEAGRSAKFAMVRSLIDVGRVAKAEEVVRDMLKESPRPSGPELIKAGLLMLDKRCVETAAHVLKAGLDALDKAAEPELDQRALIGLGTAYCDAGEHERAVQVLDRLILDYPKSGLFYRARFVLGRAYRMLGRTEEATEVLREVFERASDQNLINEATVELARVQAASGETTEALASCQRIVLLGNPDDPDGRAAYEAALAQSVALLVKLERWHEAQEAADQYLARFRDGRYRVEVFKHRTQARMEGSIKTSSPEEVVP